MLEGFRFGSIGRQAEWFLGKQIEQCVPAGHLSSMGRMERSRGEQARKWLQESRCELRNVGVLWKRKEWTNQGNTGESLEGFVY